MGQGRKRVERCDNRHYRKRSISMEIENQDTSILHYVGTAAIIRSRMESTYRSTAAERRPTPFPTRRESGYSTQDSVSTRALKERNPSPTNVCIPADSPPFVPTSVEPPAHSTHSANFYIAEHVTRTLFHASTIIQNERKHELSLEHKEKIRDILKSLLDSEHYSESLPYILSLNPSLLPSVLFEERIQFIFSLLIDNCLHERLYGVSVNIAVIDTLVAYLPHTQSILQKRLYEILLDFHEKERKDEKSDDDALYIQTTSYGQIHRLTELWSSLVNNEYINYCSYVFAHKGELQAGDEVASLSPRYLLDSLFVLLRIRGVVAKYLPIIVSGVLKLFYTSYRCIPLFIRSLNAKWPIGNPRKILSWLQLIQELIRQCHLLSLPQFEKDIDVLMKRLILEAQGMHADCSCQALTILGSPQFLSVFVSSHSKRIAMLQVCLHKIETHWNESVCEQGEAVFDSMLDYLEA